MQLILQEDVKNKLNNSRSSCKRLEKELSLLKVENQWLASNKKVSANNDSKIQETTQEIAKLKREIKEEREKVNNLTDWKNQLVEKNKTLLAENKR